MFCYLHGSGSIARFNPERPSEKSNKPPSEATTQKLQKAPIQPLDGDLQRRLSRYQQSSRPSKSVRRYAKSRSTHTAKPNPRSLASTLEGNGSHLYALHCHSILKHQRVTGAASPRAVMAQQLETCKKVLSDCDYMLPAFTFLPWFLWDLAFRPQNPKA